jgi:1-aminocyclopropane-1-carboxylate deaminase
MREFFQHDEVATNQIDLEAFGVSGFALDLRREDLLHPSISGNKFRKLKYNIIAAREENHHALLTFGGAYSNHIAAVAAAGKEFGFKTIGVIRGEELAEKALNPTLAYAKSCGMHLHFISREAYCHKKKSKYIQSLNDLFGPFYLLPEGGTNHKAILGCSEMLGKDDTKYDYICVAVGTGGTTAGIVKASEEHQKIVGFSALQSTYQHAEIQKYTNRTNYEIIDSYAFGGYGKIDSEIVRFINEFKEISGVRLDPIYTGKMMYGVLDLLKRKYFNENSRILAIHTGGLQGIEGANKVLLRKKLPLIE